MIETDFRYLEPVTLDFDTADPESFDRSLRKQLRVGLEAHANIKKAVYVVRMTGSFIIAYEEGNSPVLYVGSGNARVRGLKHIGNWVKHVRDFGKDTGVEMRILLPRRRKRENFYKNVEADLLKYFKKKYGTLPYFNSRLESSLSGRVTYNKTQAKRMRLLLSVGSGKRPWWAIRPTRANPTRKKYIRGVTED